MVKGTSRPTAGSLTVDPRSRRLVTLAVLIGLVAVLVVLALVR